ncbi:diguanylate cyclase (GGDEF) domain-containing protein [Alkalimonas amylolytica]|uniref:diguanylate cyclase n=1 Tax=Alkalimonas amylolytica TaxID=152573 RepID=A0A1H3XUR5_ALKAM|nr:GGDEF domain-containing protein [Alkalimonas amylolytica]SEA02621.1 diguanylate cyclase (GGDEF) domain-containing protein [Alkalimonas amylolytica]
MRFLILTPVLLLAMLLAVWPEHALFTALPFPLTAWLALAFVASLALLMRQTDWLYWLAFLAGHYYAVQQGLQRPISEPAVALLYSYLPVLSALWLGFLVLLPRPPLLTKAGIALFVCSALLPVCLLYLPLPNWQDGLPDYHWLLQPVLSASPLSWLQATVLLLVVAMWLALLSYRNWPKPMLGQLAVLLCLTLFYLWLAQPELSGWATLIASSCLLLTLALQMLQLAYIDELTQLPQRRALIGHLNRLGKKSAVTMLDVDHFKKFNDTYGHDVGDQVLRLLGAILAKQRGMTAYRYGGEEFTLVFHHANPKKLKEQLEQVRQQVADYPLVVRQAGRPKDSDTGKKQRSSGQKSGGSKTVQITISLGCAIRQPGEKPEPLLKRADEALYKAKKKGRNCVVLTSS